MVTKRKIDSLESLESPGSYDESNIAADAKKLVKDLKQLESEPAESDRRKRVREATFGTSPGNNDEALFAPQTIDEDVAQQPEQPEQQRIDTMKDAEVTAKPPKQPSNTNRLSKAISAIKQLEGKVEELKELEEQVVKMEQQQGNTIKKSVESAFTEEVTKAVERAIAEQLPKEIEKAVAEQLPKEIEKAVAEQLPKEIEKAVADQLPKKVEKAEEAITVKANKSVESAIAKNNAAFEGMKADLEQKKKKTTGELQTLRDQLKEAREQTETQHTRIAKLAEEHEAAIANIKKEASQSADSAKEAREKLQQALEEKEAIANLREDIEHHSNLLQQQKAHLSLVDDHSHVTRTMCEDAMKQLDHISSHTMRPASPSAETLSAPDLMDLSDAPYPSPNSTHFTSSTSSTTNDASMHNQKPRQALMFTPRRNANPFASSMARKVTDPENIAMENHSRKGLSSKVPSSDESDEESPTSNSLPNVHSQRFANILAGAGQSSSRRAPRNKAVPTNNSQQYRNYPSDAEQPQSRRALPPLRTPYAPTEDRVIYPRRNTQGPYRAQANYTQPDQYQQQHYANDDLDGDEQPNFRRAAPLSRKRARYNGNDEPEYFHMETPSQEQDVRSSKRARSLDDAQQSNFYPPGDRQSHFYLDDVRQTTFSYPDSDFGHPESQLPTQGRGGRGRGGRDRSGHPQTEQSDWAPPNSTAQSSSRYAAPPLYNQAGYTPGPARRNNTAQPPSSYVASPSDNQGRYTPRDPAPRKNTAQSSPFQAESTPQEVNVYAPSRVTNANKRTVANESRRAPQAPKQSQPQQPQYNGRGDTDRNGRARNGDVENPRGGGSHQGNIARAPAPPRAQRGAQQGSAVRTPASEPQFFRDARGHSPESVDEGRSAQVITRKQLGDECDEIVAEASAAKAKNQSGGNKGPSQNSAKSTGGSLEPRNPFSQKHGKTPAPPSFNGEKGSLASRMTFPSDDDESSAPLSFKGKGKKKFDPPTGGSIESRATYPTKKLA